MNTEGKCGWIILGGGGGGGQRLYWPPSKIMGGGGGLPPLHPPFGTYNKFMCPCETVKTNLVPL